MPILSRHSALELRRIIKDATDRNISEGEAYAIWHYLLKLLKVLWQIEKGNRPQKKVPGQQSLFARKKKPKR